MAQARKQSRHVVCISNAGYPASLEVRKIYELLPDARAKKAGMVRVIDESGEDYLYPAEFFLPVDLPASVLEAFQAIA